MKAVVAAFNQEKIPVGAFSVIVQPVVEPMDRFTALIITPGIFQHFLMQAVKKLCVEEGWSETDLDNLTRLCDHIDSHGLTGATKMQVYRIRVG